MTPDAHAMYLKGWKAGRRNQDPKPAEEWAKRIASRQPQMGGAAGPLVGDARKLRDFLIANFPVIEEDEK